MSNWFIVRLPPDPESPASWIVADAAGRIVLPSQQGTLHEAALAASGQRVCVLVPGADVLVTDAELPPRASGARLLQVVPFALEEQLAEDVDQLHFAVGRRAGDAPRTPVAVVARSLMDEWTAQLAAAGLRPVALHADSDLLPANPGNAAALLEHDTLVLRGTSGSVVTVPADSVADVLETELTASESPQPGLLLYTSAAEWQRHGKSIEALRTRFENLKVQLLSGDALPLFAQQLPAGTAINLLQGSYAPAGGLAGSWRSWRIAAALLAALLVANLASKGYELWSLRRAEKALDASIATTYQSAMRGEPVPADARRRMESRLLASQGAAGGALLPVLNALAQAQAGTPGTVVQAMSYRDGTLDLRLVAPNADSLDRISQALRAGGFQADLTSGSAAANGYEGRIQVKSRGAS